MASSQSTADFIVEQIAAAGTVSARKMFGARRDDRHGWRR